MKTFILHANQSVMLSSKHGYWKPETLNSKPTFSIEAETEADAKAYADVVARYETDEARVENVSLQFPLVRIAS
jgi:hypothetical protein